jgi:CBS domain-containing protein
LLRVESFINKGLRKGSMNIKDVMSTDMLNVNPGNTLREAAQRMSERNAGAAIVADEMGRRPGIITERDILNAIAGNQDPDKQQVGDNATADVVTVPADSPVEEAVEKMMDGDFRHLLVVHGEEVVGLVSMRDLVRALTSDQ